MSDAAPLDSRPAGAPRVPITGDELAARIPWTLAAAAFGGLFCIVAWLVNKDIFFRSFLSAWLFFLGITLGSMGVMFMHHTIGGMWGLLVRRIAEAAMLCLPLLIVLFIIVCLGIPKLYPWAVPDEVAHDPILQFKRGFYFATWFFVLRGFFYLAVFLAMIWAIRTTSLAQDQRPAPPLLIRLNRISAGGAVVYAVLMTLAGIDWIMSREPHWYSTVFGFIMLVGQGLSGIAFLILVLSLLVDREPFVKVATPNLLNDLGNIMLMFVVLWAYMSLAQLLVIWMGNIQQDITWYVTRTTGGWRVVSGILIALHFFVPFYLLLFRAVKRRFAVMGILCACILPLRFIDIIYWVLPSGFDKSASLDWRGCVNAVWMLIVCWLFVGGLWLAAFLWNLKGKPLMPIGERVPVTAFDHGHGQRPTPGTVV